MSRTVEGVSSGLRRASITIPARGEYVSLLRLALAGLARDLSLDEEDIEDIKVAVSEVSNAIIQQAENRPEANLTLEMEIDEQSMTAQVGCSGDLDVKALAPVLWSETPGTNMGISLITALTDKVELDTTSADCTVLRLVKFLRK